MRPRSGGSTVAVSMRWRSTPKGAFTLRARLPWGQVSRRRKAVCLPKSETATSFVLKLDPSGKKLVYSTYIDHRFGQQSQRSPSMARATRMLAAPPTECHLRTTAGAFRPDKPEGSLWDSLAKLSADGSTLLASTFLFAGGWGGTTPRCRAWRWARKGSFTSSDFPLGTRF